MPVVVAGAAGAGATGSSAAGGAAGGGGLAGSGLVPVNPVLDLRALGTPANHLMKVAEGQAVPFDPKS
ncbi:MAG: hypothetical protein KDA49_05575, partial [Rhodospirillaceae bacterium]|nr:hypothetical protein [Rhodospirillaceae bacterium]